MGLLYFIIGVFVGVWILHYITYSSKSENWFIVQNKNIVQLCHILAMNKTVEDANILHNLQEKDLYLPEDNNEFTHFAQELYNKNYDYFYENVSNICEN